MSPFNFKQEGINLLQSVDIKVGGSRPWDIQIKSDKTYSRVFRDGTLGFGEAYLNGEWECQAVDQLMEKIISGNLHEKVNRNIKFILYVLLAKIINYGRKDKAFEIGQHHYDIGNDLFTLMLDKRMVYTCGYWGGDVKNLDEAQEAKLDLVCKKIELKPGMKVLDIGGGWGSFAKFAAEKYKVSVVNITVSKEQIKLADKLCKGLPVENRLQDYRDVDDRPYDRIVSLGMFEHVGYKNYKTYFHIVHRNLKEDGLFLLQTIGQNYTTSFVEPWTRKYIFPNAMLPSMKQISEAVEKLFVTEDWHNFGPDYDKTLMVWLDNFEKNWPKLKDRYGERFYRMWRYWLMTSAATFRSRNCQLWQLVLSKHGITGGYKSIR